MTALGGCRGDGVAPSRGALPVPNIALICPPSSIGHNYLLEGGGEAHFIAEIFWGKTFWVAELGACNRILG